MKIQKKITQMGQRAWEGRWALSAEASIHTAKITINKEALKKIYIQTLGTLCNPLNTKKESYLILIQIYDILAELQEQDKKIMLCKVPTNMELKETKMQIKQQNKQ